MHQFVSKLKHVEEQIKIWNIQVFKNVFKQKEVVKLQLEEIHCSIIKNGMDSNTYIKQKELQHEWEELCNREEEYWRQNFREVWLQKGDKNTNFFHASAQQKWAAKSNFQILNVEAGNILTNA